VLGGLRKQLGGSTPPTPGNSNTGRSPFKNYLKIKLFGRSTIVIFIYKMMIDMPLSVHMLLYICENRLDVYFTVGSVGEHLKCGLFSLLLSLTV